MAEAAPLLVIVGPTAAGKTALSLELAEALSKAATTKAASSPACPAAEIISADSRTIYQRMDIGTAKATPEEQARVPHHLLDVVPPDQVLTLAEYQRLAYEAISAIHARGSLPLLVGGTGQYVAAVLEGWRIPEVAPQPELRSVLEAEAAAKGAQTLHARLATLDPVAAARIDQRNIRRVIRALEVCLVTGQPISALQAKSPPPYRTLLIGITRLRPILYERIDRRVDSMLAAGLVDEVRRLADAGYSWDLPAMTGLGYRQIGQYLRGEVTLDEAAALIKKGTRRFVQQQHNWFRPADPSIRWLDPSQTSVDVVLAEVRDYFSL